MNDFYKMVTDNMVYSFSSVSSFKTCPLMFKLTYINSEDRGKNWYADFGLLMHEVLEKYFKGELDIMELSTFYEENYSKLVTSPPPPYPAGIAVRYYEDGLEFLNNFDFQKDNYNIISIEDEIKTTFNDIKLVVKPDLVLQEKSTGDVILFDYKTSNPFKDDKPDKKKIKDYVNQTYLYSYFINHTKDIKISKIKLWFVRINKWYEFDYNEEEAGNVVNWFYDGILNIRFEENFDHCDTVKGKFFCQNLCSVSSQCPFKP